MLQFEAITKKPTALAVIIYYSKIMNKLSSDEIYKKLHEVSGWQVSGGVLQKEFVFRDFVTAMEFMNQLAVTAEQIKHHPDWSNSYNKVLIKLTTHGAGGLTQADFIFAKAADTATAQLLQ